MSRLFSFIVLLAGVACGSPEGQATQTGSPRPDASPPTNPVARSENPRGVNRKGLRIEDGRMSVPVGIETLGGVFTALIPAGTRAPAVHTEIFTTAADNQSSVEIHLLGGNAPMASENKTLGKFSIVGIREASRGVPQIEVAIAVDERGILHVSAKDLETGHEQEITVMTADAVGKDG